MGKNHSQDAPRRKPIWFAVKVLLLVVAIAVVPLVLREADFDKENVRLVGRGVAGLGLLVLVYAFVQQMAKTVMVLAIALLTFVVLVSEGVIDLPTLMN